MGSPTSSGGRRRSPAWRLLAAVAGLALAGLTVAALPPHPASAADVPTGTLSLYKRIENLDTGSGFGDRSVWTMHAENVDTGETFEGDGLNGFQTRTVPEGTYRISESGTVAGYRFNNWSCSNGSPTTEREPLVYVGEGDSLTCTVENVAIKPSLTLRKQVSGGDADPTLWQLHARGPDSLDGPTGSDAVTNVPVRIGTYTLSEDAGPAGYTAGDWACDVLEVGGDTRRETVPQGGSLDVVLGDRIVCTVVNSTQGPHLTLRKVVDNAGGGTATASDWTLTAAATSGGTTISGTSGSSPVTDAGVPAGRYDLSESGGPAGYTAGAWVCDGGTGANGTAITLGTDDDVTCTVTNTWSPAHLTLVKNVVQTRLPAGRAAPSDWTLSARDDAGDGFSGTSGEASATGVAVAPGTYTLSEDGPAGYQASDWTCDGGTLDGSALTLATGDDVTCTITNTLDLPDPAQLTLVKAVEGGPDVVSDWTLTATRVVGTGLPAFSGTGGSGQIRNVAVLPGTFELTEAPSDGAPATVAGYTASDWTCDGGDLTTVDGNQRVTLAAGDVVTCTVTNTWQGGTLTLVKDVDNAWGGTATPADWVLRATRTGATLPTLVGRTGSDAVTDVDVVAGTYDLAESAGPVGYASQGWSCTSGLEGSAVTVGAGDDVTCTVTNADQPAHLTLIKRLDPLRADGAEPTDFTLTATNGTTTITGRTGEDAVTRVAVPAGSYTLTETGPGGFRSVWACLGARSQRSAGNVIGAPGNVVVGLGQDVRCTVVNAVPGPVPTPTPTPTPTTPTTSPTPSPTATTPAGPTTPGTTPSSSTTVAGGGGGGGLAMTGAPLALVGGLGALLLLAGTAALLARRYWLRH
ncbi:hypothetical protein ACFT5B_10550 [Luteimicrobium sp. NPDC057192]|uniref:hypothetical protein n=1 Tax=Luteimicrobium sp. NPDC057192 TaxID=3346042 RepID=UPI00362DC3C0